MGNVTIDPDDTAVVFTDPRVVALKPESVMRGKIGDVLRGDVVEKLLNLREDVGESDALEPTAMLREVLGNLVGGDELVANLSALQDAGREGGVPVFYSPTSTTTTSSSRGAS